MRIIRTCRDMGIATVAVYSDCDRNALHVRMADEAYAIGPDQASQSYLRIDKLTDVARTRRRRCGASRLRIPGREPRVCGGVRDGRADVHRPERAGHAGDGQQDWRAGDCDPRRRAGRAGKRRAVPADAGDAELAAAASAMGYPLLVKAVAGGEEKACASCDRPRISRAPCGLARSEALSSFGDDRVYFERRLEQPRHIEVQLLGDRHGTVVPFVERECSIQRRHQKLIEETPSPAVAPALREQPDRRGCSHRPGGGLHQRGDDRVPGGLRRVASISSR